MTCKFFFTRGIQKKLKNKQKKMSRQCHIIDYVESQGSKGNSEESLFYKDGI